MVDIQSLWILELPASLRDKDVIACAEFWNFSSITSMSNLVHCLADWKVEKASGMGLAHSGDWWDAVLDSLAETWSTDPVVLREHGIRLYVRFRDDMFFIGSDRRLSVSYVQELRRRAKFFHIIAECPSDSEVQFRRSASVEIGNAIPHSTVPETDEFGHSS